MVIRLLNASVFLVPVNVNDGALISTVCVNGTSFETVKVPFVNCGCHSAPATKQKLLSFESGSKITIYICEQKFTQCHEKSGCKHSDNPDSCIFDQITKTFDCTGGGYSGKIYLTSIPDRTNSLILKNLLKVDNMYHNRKINSHMPHLPHLPYTLL